MNLNDHFQNWCDSGFFVLRKTMKRGWNYVKPPIKIIVIFFESDSNTLFVSICLTVSGKFAPTPHKMQKIDFPVFLIPRI